MVAAKCHLVCGVVTGLAISVDHDPPGYRAAQQSVLKEVRCPGWSTSVAERYVDLSKNQPSPAADQLLLRTWDSDGIGYTRLPVGFVRLTEHAPEGPAGLEVLPPEWTVEGRRVTLWPDGTGVMTLTAGLNLGDIDASTLAGVRNEARCLRRAMTDDLIQALGVAVAAVSDAAEKDPGIEARLCAVPALRTVGRHWLWTLDTAPSEELEDSLRDNLALLGSGDEWEDVYFDDDRSCFPGNTVSIEIGQLSDSSPSLLLPVLEYYQYWVAAVTKMDDALYSDYVMLRRLDSPSDRKSWEEDARELFFTHRDTLSAMSPGHRAAWEGYERSWRIADIEADILDKVEAVDEISRRQREAAANEFASRTTTVVTFLTAATLVSIATGIAVFLMSEEQIPVSTRRWVLGLSAILGILMFVYGILPAWSYLARRRERGQ